MRKQLILFLIIFLVTGALIPAAAQNPFTSKAPAKTQMARPSPPNPFFAKIAQWQHQLNQKMTALVRQTKETKSLGPLLSLVLIAFAYGVLHAAGPGHGKAVAMSYVISRGGNIGRGILFGNLIALFHGMSAIGLVLMLHYVLRKRVTGSLESVSHTTMLVSYSLISLMGMALFIKSLVSWRRGDQEPGTQVRQGHPLVMALAVGMVPCPGVVLVMLFSLSMNMIGLGLLLGISLSAGMAATISMMLIIGVRGKELTLKMMTRREQLHTAERVLETGAAFMLTLLGLVFLGAAI